MKVFTPESAVATAKAYAAASPETKAQIMALLTA